MVSAERQTPPSLVFDVNDIEWTDVRPGIKAKKIWEDPSTNRRAQLTRIEPGAQIARHRHDGDELVYVVEGAISDEFGTITAGNVGYRPNGCVHTVSSRNGATVYAIISGRTEPVKA